MRAKHVMLVAAAAACLGGFGCAAEALRGGEGTSNPELDAPALVSEEDMRGLTDQGLGSDDAMFLTENRIVLADLLTALPKRERLMLHLRYFEGMTQSQIADRLDISQMHVSRLLAKSLRRLRERAEETGLDH